MNSDIMINNQVIISNKPNIPGLIFRGFQGEVDYPRISQVILGCRDEDQTERVDSLEDVQNNYRYLTNCDPYQDMLFAEIDGEVIGYNRVFWKDEIEGNRIYTLFGFLLPKWRRKGIGTAMLKHAEQRLLRIAETHSGIDQSRYFESFAGDKEIGATALLIQHNYQAVRHFFSMVRPNLLDIPDLPLPSGIEICPVTPEHYQKVYDANMEAFKDHWGFSEDDEGPLESWLENRNFDPTLWKVAWEGDQVVGMVLNYIDKLENEQFNRKRGWTENICVLRPWRKKGIAQALIAASLVEHKQRGMEEAALGVDTQNLSGALKLYEKMGYTTIKRFSTYRKPMN